MSALIVLDDAERQAFAALADVMIPAAGEMPSASEAGVAAAGIDAVLAARPDLGRGLQRLLRAARGRDPASHLAALRRDDPVSFGVLAEVVPGAYFMNARVRQAIGYEGQVARPIEAEPDDLDALLAPQRARGPIFRPTPDRR